MYSRFFLRHVGMHLSIAQFDSEASWPSGNALLLYTAGGSGWENEIRENSKGTNERRWNTDEACDLCEAAPYWSLSTRLFSATHVVLGDIPLLSAIFNSSEMQPSREDGDVNGLCLSGRSLARQIQVPTNGRASIKYSLHVEKEF